MKLPFVISNNQSLREKWETRFKTKNGYTRESIWRRHQSPENQKESGWTGDYVRRRIIHVLDRYDFNHIELCLFENYINIHLSLPEKEIDEYEDFILENIQDQSIKIKRSKNDLEYTFGNFEPSEETKKRPWRIFELGIRQKKEKQQPRKVDSVVEILKYAPFQIELGCGPSIESGIPPLSYLHSVYSTTTSEGKFVFRLEDDNLIQNTLLNPDVFYKQSTKMFLKCLEAEPTTFYKCLLKMKNDGFIVEPVLTNNFDGILKSIGIQEKNISGFDIIYPEIDFKTKSLLVIGSHADRRKIREQARSKNIQVIFIDPEKYDGKDYLIEDTQREDIVLNLTAGQFAQQYNELFHIDQQESL